MVIPDARARIRRPCFIEEMHDTSATTDVRAIHASLSKARRNVNVKSYEKSWTESVMLAGETVGEKIEALLREGNVRRIVVKQGGRTIAEFPLVVGVVGAA